MYKPALSVAVWLPVTPIKKSLSKLLLILTKFSQDHMPLPLPSDITAILPEWDPK